ncbi:MAG: metallophosphoesterase [Spirochaetaceae bacterium]|nr:MAG: metallophosphoesterase [Spirochaetaceae bacterium]
MNREIFSYATLNKLFRSSPTVHLSDKDKYVIFSDLHMGNGGKSDDFARNSDMFIQVLRDYYFPRGYTLVLNGDVEELQRFTLESIQQRWGTVYEVFDMFAREDRLYRLVGNHDLDLLFMQNHNFDLLHSLNFDYKGDTVFIFHGHQTSQRYMKYNRALGLALKYLSRPFGIRSSSVAHSSSKRFHTEKRVYQFSSRKKLLSIIGHTHRPLFESMSKIDTLKFEIERLCRKYPIAEDDKKQRIAERIRRHRDELNYVQRHEESSANRSSLYNANLVVPCMFNSGCVLGERGMTSLEIRKGTIALLYWFDASRGKKYLQDRDYASKQLGDSTYYRAVMKKDSLSYIFSRIRLLS